MFAAPQNQQNKPVELDHELSPRIAVIGVGGAGCNAVNNMVASKLEGVDFYALNTDSQSLKHSLAANRVQLGTHATRGLGAGSKPDVGRAAAEETINDFMEQLGDVNMVFITAGMGGGTGTGAAPIIARACKEAGILTVGVVTKPFHFEGAHRMRTADKGIEEIQDLVDTLIVIPNQNLFRVANEKTTFADSFRMADGVLQSGVRGITDLIVRPGMVNLDFADIRTAMVEWMGKAMMGTGEAEGDRRAIEAAERAINNPLLDDISMKGAKGVIINITCGYDMTLFEVDEAVNRIRDEVDADANIIFGTSFDDTMHGQMRVTLLATGIETQSMRKGQPTSHAAQPAMQRPPVPMTAELVVPKYNPQPATYATAQPNIVPPTVSRVGSAFIPPKPAEAHDMKHADEPHHMVPPAAVHDYHVAQDHLNLTFQETPVAAPAEVEPQRPSTLKLTPPTPGQAAHAAKQQAPKKKGMSLFDKFTSFFNQAEEEEAAEAARPAAAARTAPNMGGTEYTAMPHTHQPSVSAPQFGGQQAVASANPYDADPFGIQQAGMGQTTVTQQGTVLAAKANEQAQKDKQPDYDIPAFLRRQMS